MSLDNGALLVGHDLVLFETKSGMLPLRARAGEDPDRLFERLDEITRDAARQLNATVDHLAAGHLTAVGLDPAWVRRVFPVGVSRERVPLTHEVRAWIEGRIADAGLPVTRVAEGMQVFAFEPCTLSDLEWLELVVENTGARPGDLLARKQTSALTHGYSLASWIKLERLVPVGARGARLAHHARRWSELVSEARDFLRRHAPAGEPGLDLEESS